MCQQRDRYVLVRPTEGGRPCPKKMMRRKKCRNDRCDEGDRYWYQGSWRVQNSYEFNRFDGLFFMLVPGELGVQNGYKFDGFDGFDGFDDL